MRQQLRRQDRALSAAETRTLLDKGEYGVLSTRSADGQPYGVPLHYCLIRDALYFHCASQGRKLDDLGAEPRVSFCVVGDTEVLPDRFATRFESVIVDGRAVEVMDEEKQQALKGLLAKYSADYFDKGLAYIKADGPQARVFRIDIDEISGKARR